MARPPGGDGAAPSGIGITFLVLRRPEFLAYLTAAISTITCVWLLETTLQWVVLTSSGSSALVGAVYVAIFVPIVILVVPVGLVIDRYGAKPLLFASQAVWCCSMVAGATLNHFGWMNSQVVILLAVLDGVCNAMWTVPAQLILGRVVRKELMASAIGLGLLQFAAGRIIGGSLAAATLAAAGPTATLLLGAASAAIGMAAGLRVRENRNLERRSMAPPRPADIRQAFAWTMQSGPAVALLALGGITALFTVAYLTLLPAVSRTVLHAGPAGLGLMTASGGVGLAVAAFVTDPLGRVVGRGAMICLVLGCTAFALAILGISASLVVSVAAVGVIAGCLGVFSATNNSLLQALAPPEMRGRVLAFYGLVVWVIFPISALALGLFADRFGASFVLQAMGALTLVSVVGLLLAYRPLRKLDIASSGAAQLRTRPVMR
jgi:MFS family permease